jgi:hypothetical protein
MVVGDHLIHTTAGGFGLVALQYTKGRVLSSLAPILWKRSTSLRTGVARTGARRRTGPEGAGDRGRGWCPWDLLLCQERHVCHSPESTFCESASSVPSFRNNWEVRAHSSRLETLQGRFSPSLPQICNGHLVPSTQASRFAPTPRRNETRYADTRHYQQWESPDRSSSGSIRFLLRARRAQVDLTGGSYS